MASTIDFRCSLAAPDIDVFGGANVPEDDRFKTLDAWDIIVRHNFTFNFSTTPPLTCWLCFLVFMMLDI